MGVLFVMPTWAAPSELWMQRMLAGLGDNLAGVACYRPQQNNWNGVCPTFDLIGRDHAARQLRKAAAQCGPSAVLVHYLPFGLLLEPALRENDAEVFVHAHGYDLTWNGRRTEPPHSRRFDDAYPGRVVAMNEWATFIVASQTAQRRLESIGVANQKIQRCPLGVPVPNTLPERLASPPINVLYLGRLIDFKGPELTIAAFELACQQGLNATFTIAGDGPLRDVCEARVGRSPFAGRIRMTGAVSPQEGQRLREAAHVFTAHSQTGPTSMQEETFGVGFVEAMAAGLPIVTGRNGSLPEIVSDGVEGILFEPGDLEVHAAALVRLGNDTSLRNRLGQAGHRRASRQYTHRRAAERLRTSLLPTSSSKPNLNTRVA